MSGFTDPSLLPLVFHRGTTLARSHIFLKHAPDRVHEHKLREEISASFGMLQEISDLVKREPHHGLGRVLSHLNVIESKSRYHCWRD